MPRSEAPGPYPSTRAMLDACQAAVVAARAQLDDARRRGARLEIDPSRENLVAALENYAATIERSGAPLPPRLHAELSLYRNLGHRA
ncbi:hypothetical protein [Pimelobacter simplex]|uniref:hypothetical protein n=1 Tax=Nocardioides simplex TaxID=2045 RepID=UPI0019338B45|nr:hypothetical protein [Pimelobacter simplex]